MEAPSDTFFDDPCLRLWFHVFVDAIKDLQRYPSSEIPRNFLFDEDNSIIDALAEALGTTVDTLRNRTRAGIERTQRTRMPYKRRSAAG